MNVCVFEDQGYEAFYPLTTARPVYDLLLGTSRILDKVTQFFSREVVILHCRDFLKPILKQTYKGMTVNQINSGSNCLFIF